MHFAAQRCFEPGLEFAMSREALVLERREVLEDRKVEVLTGEW